MQINIRLGNENDFEAVLTLIKEPAIFQQMPEKVTNTVELMRKEKSLFNCLLAENEHQEIVGIAVYCFVYYTWVGKSLYLDDLYVKQTARGKKIASALLQKMFDVAKTENCKRVRWQVSDWNEPAIGFYRKCGADIDQELYNCDFDQKAIERFSV